MKADCVFCKIAKKEIPTNILFESDNFIAFYDIKPRAQGHTLIVPKRHFVTLLDIPNRLGNEMLEFTKKVAGHLLDKKQGEGFNILMNNLKVAGQIVMHAHIYIIPRKERDGIRPRV